MASLKKRNGVYHVQFFDSSRSPNRKRYSLGTPRVKVAHSKLVTLERAWSAGEYDPWETSPSEFESRGRDSSISIQNALSRFLQTKAQEGCTPKSIANYSEICSLLVRQVGGGRLISAISTQDVHSFVYAQHLSGTSSLTYFTHIRAWLRWCKRTRLIQRCPTDEMRPPKRPKKMPKAVRPHHLTLIEEAMREDYKRKLSLNQINEGDIIWMIPMFWFALYSGLRSSEFGRLRWKHVDLQRRQLSILQQKNRKEQTIPVTKPAAQILHALGRDKDEFYVFRPPNGHASARDIPSFVGRVGRSFRTYRKLAGIDQKLTPHGLRHGFCTLLAEAGKPAPIIMEAARHSDINTSMRYVHVANERLKAELDDVF